LAASKILILVLAINKDPWERIEIEGQQLTWRSSSPDSTKIFRYIGASPQSLIWKLLNQFWLINYKIKALSRGRVSIFSINFAVNRRKDSKSNVLRDKNEIITTVPDLYSLIGAKTLDAFAVSVQEFDFDYIYRTNVSSYLDLTRLQRFAEGMPRNNLYAGLIGNHHGISFASGCGYFISRDLVIKVLQNKELWDHNEIDDVSLGKLLNKNLGVEIEEIKRIDLDSSDFDFKIGDNPLGVFHYRCKAADPNTTIQIMHKLHKMISIK